MPRTALTRPVRPLGRPTIVVHRPSGGPPPTPADLASVAAVAGVTVAVAAPLGHHSLPPDVRSWLTTMSPNGPRFADPESWRRPDQLAEASPANVASWPHLAAPRHSRADRDTWLDGLLTAQTTVGATVLLGPGTWVGRLTADLRDALALDTAARAVAGPGGPPLLTNLALHQDWFREPARRAELAREIRGHETDGWWVRARRNGALTPTMSEIRDARFLEGLRVVSLAARRVGVPLIFPKTGLAGWVASALGATGFGTGTQGTQRVWQPKGGGGGHPETERFFVASLLHHVESTRLAGLPPGTVACPCPGCPPTGGIAADRNDHNHLHYLYEVARLSADLTGTAPKAAVLARVTAALARAATVGTAAPALLVGNAPRHLARWEHALR